MVGCSAGSPDDSPKAQKQMTSRVLPFPATDPGARRPPFLARPEVHQALLLAAAVLLIFTRLWETTLSSYDDAYYAEKAKEILLTGSWLVPPWNYQPAFDNPPLSMWTTAVLFRAFGISEFTARMTSAACGVGCIMLTYRFGRRFFGPWVGFFAGAALLTTPYFIKYSRHAMLDTMQTLLVGGALYLLALGLQRDRTAWSDLGAGVLTGLAVLNKSVLGFFPLVIYLVWVAVARPPLRRALRPGLLGTLAAALLLPGAWFGAATAAHGTDFLREHFGRIIWHRAVHGDPGASLTWLSRLGYLEGLFVNFLPWIFLAIWGVRELARGKADRRRALLPICWAGVVLVLLTLSAAQKSWYLMPAFPALAILAGVGLNSLLAARPRGREIYTAGLAILLGVFHLVTACTPVPMGRDRNRDLAAIAPAVRAAVPPGEHVLNFNLHPPWKYISPMYFYADRPLALPETDLDVMARILEGAEGPAVLTDLATLERLSERMGRAPRALAASGELVLLGPDP